MENMFGVKGKTEWEEKPSHPIHFVFSESFREAGFLNDSQLWVMNQKSHQLSGRASNVSSCRHCCSQGT